MYTIIFRKGKIELELTTDDKYAVEKQLDLIINQASNYTSSKTIDNTFEPKEPTPAPVPVSIPQESTVEQQPTVIEEQPQTQIEQPQESLMPEVKPAEFQHINEAEKKSIIQNAEEIIPQSIDIAPVKPLTINSMQNPEPVKEPEVDFDKILNNEISNQDGETPILKDSKFIEYVEGKSALEKIDFLVITAQYLAQYENMNTFNLKHVNAKLMQNFTIIVDHSVLQSAITRGFITRIQESSDESASEYMLTEKGLRSF